MSVSIELVCYKSSVVDESNINQQTLYKKEMERKEQLCIVSKEVFCFLSKLGHTEEFTKENVKMLRSYTHLKGKCNWFFKDGEGNTYPILIVLLKKLHNFLTTFEFVSQLL